MLFLQNVQLDADEVGEAVWISKLLKAEISVLYHKRCREV